MQNNERLTQVGLKLAFAEQTLKQQTDRKTAALICLTATSIQLVISAVYMGWIIAYCPTARLFRPLVGLFGYAAF